MGRISNFLNSLALAPGDEWQIALRRKTDKTLLDGNGDGFSLIPNTFRYWYADPFLFEYNGDTYIFAEMYDRTKKKGAIGWAIINGLQCTKFTVCLELEHHLSYPCIFRSGKDIYMVPECYQSGCVTLYRATDFPNNWEKSKVLFNGLAVDTTPLSIDGTLKFITTVFANKEKRINNNLNILDECGKNYQVISSDYSSRCAGMPFCRGEKTYRPAQNCGELYGSQIVFKEIIDDSLDNYKEANVLTVGTAKTSGKVIVNLINDPHKHTFVGIHTYNATDDYEVVDLKYLHSKSTIYFCKNLFSWIKVRIFGIKDNGIKQ